MKEKQRDLGTESHLSSSNESGGKGEISIYSILLTTTVSLEVTIFPPQRFIPSQQFYPLFVNNPEILSAQQKLTKSNKLRNYQQSTTKMIKIRMLTILK